MDADEKKIMDALAASADDVDVPASLAPDAVRARLVALEAQSTSDAAPGAEEAPAAGRGAAPQKKRRQWFVPAVAAACLALLCGVGVLAASATGILGTQAPNGSTISAAAPARGQSSVEAGAVSAVPTAESYDQLDELAAAQFSAPSRSMGGIEATAEAASAAEDSALMDGAAGSPAAGDFSQTNVRTEGVDEADVVKTDGRALFALQSYGNRLVILSADDGQMEQVAAIEADEGESFSELYVSEGRLFLIVDAYDFEGGGATTRVDTYDIADAGDPRLVATLEQGGYYHSSRLTGGYLYLFTNFYPQYGISAAETERYVPSVDGEVLACDDVFVPACAAGPDYLVVSSMNTDAPGEVVERKALAGASSVYVSTDSIYVYGPEYLPVNQMARAFGEVDGEEGAAIADGDDAADAADATGMAMDETMDFWYPYASDDTIICKLSYHEGSIDSVGETRVAGFVDDGFSIDEYEGNTRVITTVYGDDGSMSNNVYVLDAQLHLIGSLTNLAPGERVYSARLMGPIGYFVTYRETDPLFSVDLSDPANPRVLGELKIPGFSEYLHPWGEGRLLGIGMATSEDGIVTEGLKLSMFDVSNPADVSEEATLVLEDSYWAQALYDHRAVFADVERGLVGFSAEGEDEAYYLFKYEPTEGFSEALCDELGEWAYNGARGVRIGEVLYVVGEGQATSFSLATFDAIDRADISEP